MAQSRVVVITGGSSGIGKAAATELAREGATVIVTGRDGKRTNAVADDIGGVAFVTNFERLDDVRQLASTLTATFPRIDVLANNAGGMYNTNESTVDGFERTFQVNYLAPYLLTRLLLPRLRESGGRVVSTSSTANKQGKISFDDLDFTDRRWNSGLGAYGASKLAINMFTSELAKRSSVRAYAFHPGLVRTGLAPDWWVLKTLKAVTFGKYGISAEEGARSLLRLAAPDFVAPTGTYFDREKPDGKQGRQAADEKLSRELWIHTSKLVGLNAAEL